MDGKLVLNPSQWKYFEKHGFNMSHFIKNKMLKGEVMSKHAHYDLKAAKNLIAINNDHKLAELIVEMSGLIRDGENACLRLERDMNATTSALKNDHKKETAKLNDTIQRLHLQASDRESFYENVRAELNRAAGYIDRVREDESTTKDMPTREVPAPVQLRQYGENSNGRFGASFNQASIGLKRPHPEDAYLEDRY